MDWINFKYINYNIHRKKTINLQQVWLFITTLGNGDDAINKLFDHIESINNDTIPLFFLLTPLV